jgi:hypothetical protein
MMMLRRAVRDDQQGQVGWYEAGLSLGERKRRGHFSTPPALVEAILDACGYTPDADLTGLRVLDPACGSGNFLISAALRLVASAERQGHSQADQDGYVARNIWGFDPDPVSCCLAKLRFTVRTPHIHQADSLSMPWEPCVDLFVANPPYLAAKNTDLSGYRSALQRGQSDSYLLFLSLALSAVRPGGWLGLVLPDPVLARYNAARERAKLLHSMTLHALWHLSDVFDAEVGAVVIIAQNVPPLSQHPVTWVRARWQSSLSTAHSVYSPEARQVPQSLLQKQPASELRYLLSSEGGALLDQLRASLDTPAGNVRRIAPLGDYVTISRGEELGRDSRWITRSPSTIIDPSETTASPSHIGTSVSLPLLRGGVDVRPYVEPRSEWRIAREAVTKPVERYLSPKLLVVKSTDRLQATLDRRGHVALQTLYVLRSCNQTRDEASDELYFFLALLNSRLLREYVYVLHTAYKWVQPQIEQRVLASLPVPIVGDAEREAIIEQAKLLERACSRSSAVVEWDGEIGALYETLEQRIRALYLTALDDEYGDKGAIYG